jgi:hypothetical protein
MARLPKAQVVPDFAEEVTSLQDVKSALAQILSVSPLGADTSKAFAP